MFDVRDLPTFKSFDDLPKHRFSINPEARTWIQTKRWGTKKLRFSRPAATPIAVHRPLHAMLCEMLAETAKIMVTTHALCKNVYQGKVLTSIEISNIRSSIFQAAQQHLGITRDADPMRFEQARFALNKAIERAQTCAKIAAPITLSGDLFYGVALPGSVTVRIPCGERFRDPIEVNGAWLKLGHRIQWVLPDIMPENAENAAYFEVAHMAQRWHIRPVFASGMNDDPPTMTELFAK